MLLYKTISLFSGCGGLDLGFTGGFNFLGSDYPKNSFDIVWANDIDKNSCVTYRKNFDHEIIEGDIWEILDTEPLFGLSPPKQADVVIGGFPCQDFSLAGKRRGFANQRRGLLYQAMMNVVEKAKPLLFVAENVPGLLTINGGESFKKILSDFASLGYRVSHRLYNTADYGVPQTRKRVIIVCADASRLPEFTHPSPLLDSENWVVLRDAIGDLEHKTEGAVPNHYWSKAKMFKGTQGNTLVSPNKPGPTMRAEHHGNIEWHWNGKRRLSAREAARIQSFPDSFIFYPSTSSAYKQVGNAVPPVLAWHVAKAVTEFLDEH